MPRPRTRRTRYLTRAGILATTLIAMTGCEVPVFTWPAGAGAPAGSLLDARFAEAPDRNVALQGDKVLVDGVPVWEAITGPYGSGNDERQYYRPENATLGSEGLTLTAKRGFVLSDYEFSSGFLSSRDAGWYAPRWSRITVEARLPRSVEGWPGIWLRHRNGSSTAEVDLVEIFAAQIGGDVAQANLHKMGGSATSLHKVRAELPMDGGFHRFGVDIRPEGEKGARIQFYLDDKPMGGPWVQADATGWTSRAPIDATWDIAIQNAVGGLWVADPLVPYTGYLQNGVRALPLGPDVTTWRPTETHDVTVRRVTVEPLLAAPAG